MLKVMFHKIIQSKILEDGGGNLLLSLLVVIVTAVVFNGDAMRKFIYRVSDDWVKVLLMMMMVTYI